MSTSCQWYNTGIRRELQRRGDHWRELENLLRHSRRVEVQMFGITSFHFLPSMSTFLLPQRIYQHAWSAADVTLSQGCLITRGFGLRTGLLMGSGETSRRRFVAGRYLKIKDGTSAVSFSSKVTGEPRVCRVPLNSEGRLAARWRVGADVSARTEANSRKHLSISGE